MEIFESKELALEFVRKSLTSCEHKNTAISAIEKAGIAKLNGTVIIVTPSGLSGKEDK